MKKLLFCLVLFATCSAQAESFVGTFLFKRTQLRVSDISLLNFAKEVYPSRVTKRLKYSSDYYPARLIDVKSGAWSNCYHAPNGVNCYGKTTFDLDPESDYGYTCTIKEADIFTKAGVDIKLVQDCDDGENAFRIRVIYKFVKRVR